MIKAIFAPTKRLMLVLSMLLTISAVYAGGGGTKTYYAKATVAVADESRGVGLVYVIDKDGTRFPNSGGSESTGTEDMSQEDNSNFSIKIGAIATDPNYCVKEWKKDGTTVITATGQEMSQTIKGTETNATITAFVAYFVRQITPNSTNLTINAATGAASTNITVYNTTELTVDALSAELAAKFTCTVAEVDAEKKWILTVNSTDAAVSGDEVTLTLRNNNGATAQVVVNFVENQKVTFKGSAWGTYRVSQGNAYTQVIEESTNAEPLTITDPTNFILSFSEITPISGYRFNRFKLTPETGAPYYIYDDEQDGNAQSGTIVSNTTIEPEFVPTNYAQFIIVGDTAIHYSTLDRAFEKAAELGKTVVAVYQPGTVNVKMSSGGVVSSITRPTGYQYQWVLPKPASGTYTIPAGYTLLIPGLESSNLKGTASATEAKHVGYTYQLGKTGDSDYVEASPTPMCICKLSIESGTTIQVNGNISVYSCLSPNQGYTGRPTGYGQIHMENGSRIQVNVGGILHVLGYITGDPMQSTIVAKNGSTIYEAFQLTDWRGGTAMTTGSLVGNNKEVFPDAQYYVQNIETMLELEQGAAEYLTTAVDVSSPFPVTSAFVTTMTSGEDLGLFALGSGTKLQKYYDPATDRLKINLIGSGENAEAELSYMYLEVKIKFIFELDYSLDSREYVLPINNNIDVLVKNVKLNIPYKCAFLAGSSLTVNPNAQLNIQNEMYLYDRELNVQPSDQTKGYNGSGDYPIKPITYTAYHNKAPGLRTSEAVRYPTTLTDATFVIDGTLTMEGNGALYTTTYGSAITGVTDASEAALIRDFGANITSNGGGVMNFNHIGTKTTTNQISQTGSDVSWVQNIPVCNAWLRNADGTRSGGTEAKQGETYMYSDGKWEVPEADLRNPKGNEFYLTLPKDSTQNVVAEIIEHGGVEIMSFSVQLSGTQFALVGNYDGKPYKREGDNLIIPVKYTHTGKHNVANPNTGKISVTITYKDPLTSETKTKVKEIDLKATEDYKPAFSVAIVSQAGDTVKIDNYTKSYTMAGYVNMPTVATVILTPATNNVAQTLPANAWTKNVTDPFTFEYGAGATWLTDAKLTYTSAAEGTQTATLQLTASYTDATPQQVDSTITITLTGNAQKSLSTLAFQPNLMTATGDSIFQSQSIDALFETLGNTKPITFTFNGEATSDLVTIEPYNGNYRLVAHDVAGVDEPQLITIVATQEPDDAMLGKTITAKLTVLPQVAWNWGTLYFSSTTTTKPVITYGNESWTLVIESNPNDLITSLNTDATNGYLATIGTPEDASQTYTATFSFKQGDYTKTFTSIIYADPRILPYCVDNDITYNDVTLDVATKAVTYNSGTITFASTANATSTWVIEMSGVPNMLSFIPTVSEKAWRVEEFNGEYWHTILPWNMLTAQEQYELSLSPNIKQVRFTYAAGDGAEGQLTNVCVSALEGVKANTNKVYMPVAKDAENNVLPTTQKVLFYTVLNKELTLLLSSSSAKTLDVNTLSANNGLYAAQEVTITNNTDSETPVQLYVKDGATTLLTLPIQPFEFRQGLPIDLAQDDAERYHFLTTASSTDTWADSTINVTWNANNRAIAFENPDDINARRSVVFAFEGAADYIQFHTSINANRLEWIIQESEDGLGWKSAVDSLKTIINGGKGIRQALDYNTRYVRLSYRTQNLARVLVTNVKIEGTPHLIVNPARMSFTDDSEQTRMGILTLTAINLEEIRVVSNAPDKFKILYDETDLTKQVNEFTATSTAYPHALGKNKVGDVMLGVAWQALNTIDDATLTIYNADNDSVLAIVPLLGTKGMLTLDNADTTGIFTGIPDPYTYHGAKYTDYTHHPVNLTNTFATDGTALFDYLFIYGETTPASGTNITPPGKGSANASTNVGSNAVTPYYIYKRAAASNGKYVGYQFAGKVDNANVSLKETVADVIIADTAGTVYIPVQNDSMRVYMTGFCPYATTGYQKNQEGVFLFRGNHGEKLDVYLEDFHVFSRNKTEKGNTFYGDKEGGRTFSERYARGSGGVLVFENIDQQEQLQDYQPFKVTIHTMGHNLLKSNYGCFYALQVGGINAVKAYQISSPISVHMIGERHVRNTKTTLNFTDEWPIAIDANDSITQNIRTNGYLGLKKQSNNAPSIDLGNPNTEVNFCGGQVELQNAQIVSENYKTTLAISYRSGEFGSDDAGMFLSYGILTDSVGGTVNFLDGTVTVEPMWVKEGYKQYYLIDTLENGDEVKKNVGTVEKPIYEYQTSCLRTPKNTYIRGGSHCPIRACQHVTSKGGAPKDKQIGSFLGQYVYTVANGYTLDTITGLVSTINFPGNVSGLETYYNSRGYTYGLESIKPDANGNLYFWIPDGFGGVKAEKDVFISTWKACMTEIRAGLGGVVEGGVGGDTPIEPNEEVKYFLYCQLDENIHDVIAKKSDDGKYQYEAPVEVPSVASAYFEGQEYTSIAPTLVGDHVQYQVLSDTTYTITDKVYYITTATADIWKTFTAPFDVAKIYVVETYPESILEEKGTRTQILIEQARHNADFAAFFGVAMAMGTDKSFDEIYQSYIKWAKIKDQESGHWNGANTYNLRGIQELVPYTGKNWREANFYLNINKGNWGLTIDEDDNEMFDVNWEMLSSADISDNILLHKDSTYSLLFPYCTNCEDFLSDRDYWDYWSGKFLIFESVDAPQTINGRDFLNDSIFAAIPSPDTVIVKGNSTFARLETNRENVYVYDVGLNGALNQEGFIPKEEASDLLTIQPTTAFLYGYVSANEQGMPARRITRDGRIIYGGDNNGNQNGTSGHIPTVGGGNDLFITSIAGGINVAVAAPQNVRVLSSTGAVIYSGYVTTAVDIQLPTTGIYIVSGENEVQKILF
ncbi:MAG: hypothetical protein J6R26_08110 [Paludibacteraceae bacterium]|nr:hypothetical protein [Paludibacteraceae bacterium]